MKLKLKIHFIKAMVLTNKSKILINNNRMFENYKIIVTIRNLNQNIFHLIKH